MSRQFSYQHLRNSSLLFWTTYLHRDLPCGRRLVMLSAAWHSLHPKFPFHTRIHASPKRSQQHLLRLQHRR